jgi:hypothetical protein
LSTKSEKSDGYVFFFARSERLTMPCPPHPSHRQPTVERSESRWSSVRPHLRHLGSVGGPQGLCGGVVVAAQPLANCNGHDGPQPRTRVETPRRLRRFPPRGGAAAHTSRPRSASEAESSEPPRSTPREEGRQACTERATQAPHVPPDAPMTTIESGVRILVGASAAAPSDAILHARGRGRSGGSGRCGRSAPRRSRRPAVRSARTTTPSRVRKASPPPRAPSRARRPSARRGPP